MIQFELTVNNHIDASSGRMTDPVRCNTLNWTSHITAADFNQTTSRTLLQLLRMAFHSPRDNGLWDPDCFANDLKYSTQFHFNLSTRLWHHLRWICLPSKEIKIELQFGNFSCELVECLHCTSMACSCDSNPVSSVMTSHKYSAVSFLLTFLTCKLPLLNSVTRGGGILSGSLESAISTSSRSHRTKR